MKPKLRVVLDTNIYISAIIFGGNPRKCLDLARAYEYELIISKSIYLELAEKLQSKFLWEVEDIKQVIFGLSKFSTVISPKIQIDKIIGDPKDNRILECAIEVEADYIVSGDKKHLISLKKFRQIPIISATKLLEILYK